MAKAIGLAGAVTRLVLEAEMEPQTGSLGLARRAMRTARTILYGHGVDVRVGRGRHVDWGGSGRRRVERGKQWRGIGRRQRQWIELRG